MAKSRRARKIASLQAKMDTMLAAMPLPTPRPEPFPSQAESRLRAILTPEIALDMERSCIDMERIHQQMCRMSAAIDRRFGPGCPGTPGSNRTKRLRKKRSLALA